MFVVFLLALLFSADALAYESDQYWNRTQEVVDSLEVMDLEVNDAIRRIAESKRQPGDQLAFSRAVWREVGGWYWADKIERWAARSPDVDKYDQTRHKSIYRSMPIWATRVNFVFGVGRSFRVNDVMVGSDKFGHFFSQGFKYYKRFNKDATINTEVIESFETPIEHKFLESATEVVLDDSLQSDEQLPTGELRRTLALHDAVEILAVRVSAAGAELVQHSGPSTRATLADNEVAVARAAFAP